MNVYSYRLFAALCLSGKDLGKRRMQMRKILPRPVVKYGVLYNSKIRNARRRKANNVFYRTNKNLYIYKNSAPIWSIHSIIHYKMNQNCHFFIFSLQTALPRINMLLPEQYERHHIKTWKIQWGCIWCHKERNTSWNPRMITVPSPAAPYFFRISSAKTCPKSATLAI